MANFQKDDVLTNPQKRTSMYRILDIQGDSYRLVRSGKTGQIHQLAKDKNGTFHPFNEISNWEVVGHFDPHAVSQAGVKKPGVRGRPKSINSGTTPNAMPAQSTPQARGQRKQRMTGTTRGVMPSNGSNIDTYLLAAENFYSASAEAARKTRQELQRA